MCGRYTLTTKDATLAKHFGAQQGALEFAPSYNIAPTQTVPIILEQGGERQFAAAKWGLLPAWVKDPKAFKASLFNARAESLAEKASFKGPFRRQRAIIPASGFYEWQREGSHKTPHYIQLKDGAPIGFAGLYDLWQDEVLSFTIITTAPNTLMANIHDRMPVILEPEHYERWLEPSLTEVEAVEDLLRPYEGEMTEHVVSAAVNSPRNNAPELIAAA
jgi:putative SOS response-associated peptidase YedK